MTMFCVGPTRAHVMEWSWQHRRWIAVCGRRTVDVDPDLWNRGVRQDEWPLRSVVQHERLVRWCADCVYALQIRVDWYTRDVLAPAAAESSVVSR